MSAAQITAIPFDGYAAGGLSVGEPKAAMLEMAALSASMMPEDKPRYLMGVGTPADLLAAIAMGFDMFDCVLPTRNARNGMAFTSVGPVSIKQAAHARDSMPLDPACECRPCRTHSRAYLRHLYLSGEILAARALTEHNLYFYRELDARLPRLLSHPGLSGRLQRLHRRPGTPPPISRGMTFVSVRFKFDRF